MIDTTHLKFIYLQSFLHTLIHKEIDLYVTVNPNKCNGGLLICSWCWLEVTSIHVGSHNYFPTGGITDQWVSDLPPPHAPSSKSDNKLVHLTSPYRLCYLEGYPRESITSLWKGGSFNLLANPIRSSVWTDGEGAQGQVNYSIIFSVREGKSRQGPEGIYLDM